jgi:NADPH-dependent ferric siderophore reductase
MGSSDPVRAVRVERIAPLDPTMNRVTFAVAQGGLPETVRIPAGHCRLFFPDPRAPLRFWPRVFTYRRWHRDGRFDVDFALHGGKGPAAIWIARAVPGDLLGWKHGGAPKLTLEAPPAGPIVAYGDGAALPVISALLERAHPALTGHVVLDLPRAARPPPVHAPSGVSVWRLRQATLSETLETVRTHGANCPATVFVACEAGRMRALRRLALEEWRVPQERVFTSGYWKAGRSSEQVDAAKRQPDWFGDDVGQMT